jgi:mRNA interferase RelE/StbE
MNITYAKQALKDLRNLTPNMRKRIVQKLHWYRHQDDPLSFAKHLTDSTHGEYRFRIGNYRILCDVKNGKIRILVILSVKHRKDAYRKQ